MYIIIICPGYHLWRFERQLVVGQCHSAMDWLHVCYMSKTISIIINYGEGQLSIPANSQTYWFYSSADGPHNLLTMSGMVYFPSATYNLTDLE